MRLSISQSVKLLIGILGIVSVISVGTAEGGLTATGSSSNQAGAGAIALADTINGGTCSAHGPAGAAGSNSVTASCTTSLAPTSVTTSTSTLSATVSNAGTLGAETGVTSSVCGLQQATDTSGDADTAISYGGVTFGQPGPLGGNAVTLDGASGYLSTVTSLSGPKTGFTELAWFETTGSGSIVSFENVYGTTGPADWDRMLWVDPTGHVVAAVYPGSTQEARSTGSFANGAWHLAEMTVSSAGLSFYVDGALQATDPSGRSAQAYTGYWQMGWSKATQGWPDPPSSGYFRGSLSGVAVLPAALTAAQSAALYTSTSFSSYAAAVSADGPSQFWPLQQTDVGGGCALVAVTIQIGTTCLLPALASACPAPTSAATLAALSAGPTSTIPLAPSASAALAMTYALGSAPPSSLAGAHVVTTVEVQGAAGAWTAALAHPVDIQL